MRRTNKMIGDEYQDLIDVLAECVEKESLPVTLQMKVGEMRDAKFEDAIELIEWIRNDTGLAANICTYFCYECGVTHIEVVIDYPDVEDTGMPLQ